MAATHSLPTEVDLLRYTDAMPTFTRVRHQRQMSIREVCRRAEVTRNTVHAWMRGDRSPTMPKFLALARAHGYDVLLITDNGDAVGFDDQRMCLNRIDRERRLAGIGIHEMEYRSGVSFRSFFAWRNEERKPTLFNICALAMTFGAKVVMRRVA